MIETLTSIPAFSNISVISCYQFDFLDLSEKQRRALEAFRGEYSSQGKLSEEFGMSVWDTREWLKEHNVVQNNSFLESDISNA